MCACPTPTPTRLAPPTASPICGSFLNLYYRGMAVLRTERDFFELTAAYLDHAAADGARHVEVFFDPQSHVVRGVAFDEVVGGIGAALARRRAPPRRLVAAHHVLSARREPAQRPRGPARGAAPPRPDRGRRSRFGRGRHPPRDFAGVFAEATAAGFATVAHAGEEGPAAYVSEALDVLGVRRIDHGVHAIDDDALVARLRDERVTLTMCPLSNLRLGVVDTLAEHPLKRLLAAGVPVTVNSDDPAYFGGYLVDNYLAAAAALGLGEGDFVALARHSITGSLLPDSAARRCSPSSTPTRRQPRASPDPFRPGASRSHARLSGFDEVQ